MWASVICPYLFNRPMKQIASENYVASYFSIHVITIIFVLKCQRSGVNSQITETDLNYLFCHVKHQLQNEESVVTLDIMIVVFQPFLFRKIQNSCKALFDINGFVPGIDSVTLTEIADL